METLAHELAEHHEVAGVLANVGGDAPGDLWDRISAQATRPQDDQGAETRLSGMAEVRGLDEARVSRSSRGQARPRGLRRTAIAVTGVAAVVIALMGVQLGRLDNPVNHLSALAERQGMSQAVQAALLDPNAQRITLAGSSSAASTLAELVLLPSGSAYLVNSHLHALPKDETYQLWGVIGGRAVSLGLLGNEPTTVPFTIDEGARVTIFAVTAEQAGGVVASNHAPVAQSATLST